MSLSTIRSKLVTKLGEMTSLKAVYNWETSNPDGKYPFATVSLREGEGEFRSTAHNLRRQQFRINIYQEMTKIGQGPENSEEIMVTVLDELQIALDMDTTLSGAVKYIQPTSWNARYEDRETDVRLLEINVDAFELVSST